MSNDTVPAADIGLPAKTKKLLRFERAISALAERAAQYSAPEFASAYSEFSAKVASHIEVGELSPLAGQKLLAIVIRAQAASSQRSSIPKGSRS
jgi:hypothetical protein